MLVVLGWCNEQEVSSYSLYVFPTAPRATTALASNVSTAVHFLAPCSMSLSQDYLEAGADITETNTFNGTSVAQGDYAMEPLVSAYIWLLYTDWILSEYYLDTIWILSEYYLDTNWILSMYLYTSCILLVCMLVGIYLLWLHNRKSTWLDLCVAMVTGVPDQQDSCSDCQESMQGRGGGNR